MPMSIAPFRRRRIRAATATPQGFTLVELLVVMSIVVVLAALIGTSVQAAGRKAKTVQCLSKLRNLGTGILLYAQEDGEFPRSLHSAAGAGKPAWAKAILPYLGHGSNSAESEWAPIFEKLYRCPADTNKDVNIYSYALNVFFELTPDGDDYVGSPATWKKPANVEKPSRTILLAEPKAVYFSDHLMCHLWTSATGAGNAVDSKRHDDRSNYLFADGHVETLPIGSTYDKAREINLWNPSLAGE